MGGGVGAFLEFRRPEWKVGAPVGNGDHSSSSSSSLAETLVQAAPQHHGLYVVGMGKEMAALAV